MEISHNTIHRWKDRNEIYHVTKYGHPVLRWAPCAQSFVINIPTFYSLGTPFLMRLDPIAQQLFAPVSTRGESTYGRQRPKNTPVLTRKWPPGLCFMLIRRALRMWGCVEDARNWQNNFNFLPKQPYDSHQFYSCNVDTHFGPFRMTWS